MIHLIVEDPTPGIELEPMEHCEVCGEPTSTPPLCKPCQRENDHD